MRIVLGMLAASLAIEGVASPPCGPRVAARRRLVTPSGAVVAPFAVPVAVPVATVRVPSVLYAYGSTHASAPSAPTAGDAGAAEDTAERALRTHCSGCHRGAAAKGGLMIFEELGGLRARLPRQKIWTMIAEGAMPPPGAPGMDEAARDAIEEWARVPRDLEW